MCQTYGFGKALDPSRYGDMIVAYKSVAINYTSQKSHKEMLLQYRLSRITSVL